MDAFGWESFLRQWSQEILASMEDEEKQRLPPEVLESGWLGYPGATEAQIARVEARLQIILPPSYREFLQVTNGWRQTAKRADTFNHRLWSTEDIDQFAVRHPQWVKSFSEQTETVDTTFGDEFQEWDDQWQCVGVPEHEYFVYGEEQDPRKLRFEYLKTAIEISDVGFDSIYLLNPQVITSEGEWEAWFLADYLSGADRYCSFWEMMEAEYQNYLEFREIAEKEARSAVLRSTSANFEPDTANTYHSELNLESTGACPTTRIDTPPQPAAESDSSSNTWQSLERLTVELQARPVDGQVEYRTVVNSENRSQAQVWPGLKPHKFWLWLQQTVAEVRAPHLCYSEPATVLDISTGSGISTNDEFPPSTRLPNPSEFSSKNTQPTPGNNSVSGNNSVEIPRSPASPLLADLQIEQLVLRQETSYQAAQIVVTHSTVSEQSKQTKVESLISQHPLSIEITFHLVNQETVDPTSEVSFYTAQVYVQNRMTHQRAVLGITQPSPLENGRLIYTTTLLGKMLDPGMYRLQVITTLSGGMTALSSFEVPLLNVV